MLVHDEGLVGEVDPRAVGIEDAAQAPPEKAGSASALSETVQDLGVSLGVALLGSLSGTIYRRILAQHLPDELPGDARTALLNGLWPATSMSLDLPAGLREQAQAAFMMGFASVAAVCAVGVAILSVYAAVTLRHVGRHGTPAKGV